MAQLRKNPPFEIDANTPFQNDILGHQSSIELLTRLIQSTDQPFVISVEAPWGFGKTKFIERWKAYLTKQNHICLYFNAWENDFVTDPLIAFIGEFRPIVEDTKDGHDENSSIRRGYQRLKRLGAALSKKGAPILVKAVASTVLGSEAVASASEMVAKSANEMADVLSESVKKKIESYDEDKNSISKFRDTLRELANEVTKPEDKPKQLVVFVDELDRCRPDFAMTLLERIKHLFNVEKIVFVLALDREHLRNTVRLLYGSGEQADAYLRRFIDFSFQLPQPSNRIFANFLQDRFKMLDFFNSGRNNAQSEYNRFLPAFIDTSDWLKLDLRTQEQCFTRLNVIFRLHKPQDYIVSDAFSVLVGLKTGKPELYEAIQKNKTPIENHLPDPIQRYQYEQFPLLVEMVLKVTFLTREEIFSMLKTLEGQTNKAKNQGLPTDLLEQKIRWVEHLRIHSQNLIRMIEFSNGIR